MKYQSFTSLVFCPSILLCSHLPSSLRTSYHISSYLHYYSSHLTSSRLVSSYLISSRLTLSHFPPFHFPSLPSPPLPSLRYRSVLMGCGVVEPLCSLARSDDIELEIQRYAVLAIASTFLHHLFEIF